MDVFENDPTGPSLDGVGADLEMKATTGAGVAVG